MEIIKWCASGSYDNYNYLIITPDEVVAVDPWDGDETQKIAQDRGVEITHIFITHGHGDHTRGCQRLLKITDASLLYNNLEWSGGRMELWPSPGHTEDHQIGVIYSGEEATHLISGDTLFSAGVGNCKNGGVVAHLYETISTLIATLPDDLTICPGHDYQLTNLKFAASIFPESIDIERMIDRVEARGSLVTTMEMERKINPFLIAESLDEFRKFRDLRDRW